MNYEESLDYLKSIRQYGSKLGLESIRRLLELLGNPQDRLRFIHVAGTNGKGSTVVFIGSILKQAGYRVGIFTSPSLEAFEERIRINGEPIGAEELAEITTYIRRKIGQMLENGETHPTEFEISVAIAFVYFLKQKCDLVVLEVGLGGRLDATNVIGTPLISVITSISCDHTDILGGTLEAIAAQKAGIIKQNGRVVLYPQNIAVEGIITDAANRTHSELIKADFSDNRLVSSDENGQLCNVGGYKNIRLRLLGVHQLKNAAVAVKVADVLKDAGYEISDAALIRGLEDTVWPGRLEVINTKPLFIVDGAHNYDGASALRRALDDYFPGRKRIFITGVLKDKDYVRMMECLIPTGNKVFTVTPDSPRALPAGQLAQIAGCYCKNVVVDDTIEDAIKKSLEEAGQDELICAFGSLYCIGRIRKFFNKSVF